MATSKEFHDYVVDNFQRIGNITTKKMMGEYCIEQLGVVIETSYGEDVPFRIAEFVRLSGISKIVIGRSTAARKSIFHKPTLTERLIANVPNLDIHIIPDTAGQTNGL